MPILNFYINKSEEKDIFSHLMEMDNLFVPPLHTYVNIKEYAQKLFTKSLRFEIWKNNELKGLIAGYHNQTTNQYFISNYSVSPDLRGLNAAFVLLNKLDEYSKENDISILLLEVRKENLKAIAFYEKNGFKKVKEEKTTFLMERKIENY